MAATTDQINSYIASIRYAHAIFSGKISAKGKISSKVKHCEKLQLSLLGYYVRIMEDYFVKTDYENNNFFTVAEATDIMQHINEICKTNYFLNIE